MKTQNAICLFLLTWLATPAPAANTPASTPARTASSTNAPVGIPKSLFKSPGDPSEGKDPFYPKSLRPYQESVARTNTATAFNAGSLKLQGISGTKANPLAIINGRTFGTGDQLEVTTDSGKILIRCEKIGSDSVSVTVGNSPQQTVLRLRSGF